jgi:hypothetical protein
MIYFIKNIKNILLKYLILLNPYPSLIYYYNKINNKNNNLHEKYIYIENNNLSKELCNEIITKFENDNNKQPGLVSYNTHDINMKNTMDLFISNKEDWKDIDKLLFEKLRKSLEKYVYHVENIGEVNINHFDKNTITGNTELRDFGYQVQKYEKNSGFYKWHSDIKTSDNNTRFVTFLFYLNDVDEGGETLFINGKVKPKAGRLVLFPSTWTYMHKGSVPISDNKYILTGWFSLPLL